MALWKINFQHKIPQCLSFNISKVAVNGKSQITALDPERQYSRASL